MTLATPCKKVCLIASLLIFTLTVPSLRAAQDSDCRKSAAAWILELDDAENTEVLLRHTQSNCEFSGKWVKDGELVQKVSRRTRLCTDLVLIWTHKKCGYLRDYINPAAYEPCKSWTRQMFEHCMDNDVTWFLPEAVN